MFSAEALDSLWRTRSPQDDDVPAAAARRARDHVLQATESRDHLVSGAALVSLAEAHETSLNPLGVPQNLTRSLELYELAASKGNPAAQFALAALHLTGLFGAPKDVPRAITLLYFAAAGGLQEAQVALGWMHGTGRHVPKRCSSAVAYLLPAVTQIGAQTWGWSQATRPSAFGLSEESLADPGAEARQRAMRYEFVQHKAAQGEVEAKQALAFVHFSGALGKRRDIRMARDLLEELVATADRPQDYSRLGHLLAEGYFATDDAQTQTAGGRGHSRPELAAAVRAVVGQPPADAGEAEDTDPVQDQDGQTAELLLETAAGSGSSSAAAWLAILLLRRAGVLNAPDPRSLLWAADRPSHSHQAATLSMRALRVDGAFPESPLPALGGPAHDPEQGGGGNGPAAPHTSSLNGGGSNGDAGDGGQDPVERALGLLKSSSAGGDGGTKEAHFAMGVLLMRGIEARESGAAVLKRNFKRAAKHFMLAAREGHIPAILALAKMRVHGVGLDRSCDMASHLLMEASHIGAGQDELVVAAARFAGGDALGAAAAWARGAAMGFDSAAWNLGMLIDGASLADRQALSALNHSSLGWSAFLSEPSVHTAMELADSAFRGFSRALAAWIGPSRSLFSPSGPGLAAGPHSDAAAGAPRRPDEQLAASQARKPASVFGSTEWARARLAAVLDRPAQADVSVEGEASVSAQGDPSGEAGAGPQGVASEEAVPSQEVPAPTARAQATPLPVTVGLLVAANASLGPSPDLVVRAEAAAFSLFDHAVASGANTRAGIMLGEYTLAGRAGTTGSTEAAAAYFRSAAARGSARALWTLGMLHETGQGLPLDWHLAKRFYDDAQSSDAQSAGPAYFGRGRMWLKLAILRNLPATWHEGAVWLLEPVLGPFSRRGPAEAAEGGGAATDPANSPPATGSQAQSPAPGAAPAGGATAAETAADEPAAGTDEAPGKVRTPKETMLSLKQRMQRRAAKRAHSTRSVVAVVAAAADAVEQTLEEDPELLLLGAAVAMFAAVYVVRALCVRRPDQQAA
ncbi:hypothetical protein FNF29_05818 [Cafeteria roenbergensis]|uniref:Uncharacterized protein n=1 Tax=Cafeteria roenbergensis TaxID=33653 RepID=A0A5A8C909_CAFRO|nr:hypothetical protein FNF29_05818 [Cafeteria roenbergensis]|eukprot:KAA0149606.1 hypothetical protein FNF29_05818 [Cafeteria roenbergensis]